MNDPTLPQIICQECADLAVNAFLFQKLCLYSYNKWCETIDRLQRNLEYTTSLSPMVKTAYFLIEKEKDIILTSRKINELKTKQSVLIKIQDLLKEREKEQNSNKKHPCPFCYKKFPTLANLLKHKKHMHRQKKIQCAKCALMFSTIKLLKYHDATFHVSCTCKHCFMDFSTKRELRAHMKHHDIHKCPCCLKEYKNKSVLKDHMKICGMDKKRTNVICDLCKKKYIRKNSLRSHLIIEHGFGTTYSCNWCNKRYDAVSKLKQHVVKHTRERNFSCELCGGQFVTKAALMYHTRIHTGEKPFPCDLCEESFLSASRRNGHKQRKHFGPRYPCSHCDSKFISKYELNKHQERHKNPQSRLYLGENDFYKNHITNIVYQMTK